MSSYFAYDKYGFIHNDMHLDNVMMKPTKRISITYQDGTEIQTYGFLALLIDFDRSLVDRQKQETKFYWRNIENVFLRLQGDIQGDDSNMRIETRKIQDWLGKSIMKNTTHHQTKDLLTLVDNLTPKIIPSSKFVYDPDTFN